VRCLFPQVLLSLFCSRLHATRTRLSLSALMRDPPSLVSLESFCPYIFPLPCPLHGKPKRYVSPHPLFPTGDAAPRKQSCTKVTLSYRRPPSPSSGLPLRKAQPIPWDMHEFQCFSLIFFCVYKYLSFFRPLGRTYFLPKMIYRIHNIAHESFCEVVTSTHFFSIFILICIAHLVKIYA